MSDSNEALRKAARVVQKLEARLAARSEPIAIVGVGCRLPGDASDLSAFWEVLSTGKDTLSQVPSERFDVDALYDSDPEAAGKTYVRSAAFIKSVEGFDAGFFGISPREAPWIDPQHRLLLECAWEALENARMPVEPLAGSRVGVFVGIGPSEYAYRVLGDPALPRDGYFVTGVGGSFSAGRLAFSLGFQGPALAVDTACSSSLVALHLACSALRADECELALAGGVQLMLSPEPFVLLSRLRALAPDGRCRTFSDQATGYGRGEGCGVLVLKRLSRALHDGDRVLAVIRGTAVNHDGASSGLTAPNGAAQEALLRQALKDARLEASDIDYVEAHGTGTSLGDPIELEALIGAYGPGRKDPLLVGSVKTNVGHLESAAGVTGVLKIVASLRHEALPASLHAEKLNPHLDWDKLPVRVVRSNQPWAPGPRVRRAGVSAFGLSGVNAHAVLEEAPAGVEPAPAPVRFAEPVFLSARSEGALKELAGRLREYLQQHPELGLGDLALSLATTRSALRERLVFVVSNRESLERALKETAEGRTPEVAASRGTVKTGSGKLAWLFTGQGSQVPGMGQELHAEWPVFRRALDSAFEALDPHLERKLREVMWAPAGSPEAALLDRTVYAQPALFALEWALSALWASWGARPDFVAGHSIGEIAAACVAGVLSLEDAAKLVCARGRLMQAIPTKGAMVDIAASEAEVGAAIQASAGRVSIAAVNGPSETVISGVEADVLGIAEAFASRGVKTRKLAVSHAFHSALMDPMLEEFRHVAETLRYEAPRIAVISNLTGRRAGAEIATAAYWVRHVREAVRFADGVRSLRDAGVGTFIEIGPKATLVGMASSSLDDEAVLLPSLRPGRPEAQVALEALGGWVVQGGSVDWGGIFPGGGRRVDLPTYPWQRERYWVEATPAKGNGRQQSLQRSLHVMSWKAVSLPEGGKLGGQWWVLGDPEETASLAASLEGAGARTRAFGKPGELISALGSPVSPGEDLAGIVYLASKDEGGEQILAVERALASRGAGTGTARAWWITRGAVGTSAQDAPAHPDHAVLWGLARTFALEHSRFHGGIIDLPGSSRLDAELARRIVAHISSSQGAARSEGPLEDQLALRDTGAFVPRIVPLPVKPGSESHRLSPSKTALVTGGLGALGLHVARWLAGQGQKHLLLVGRRGERTPGAQAALAELRALGAKVSVVAADVSDRRAMAEAIGAIPSDAPLGSVFHTAGLSDRNLLEDLTPERFREVVASKRDGTWVLDELTKGMELDAFMCFSSISGVWGSGSQAAYAAANAFLDAWAQSARARGVRSHAIAWGPWAGGGMADAESLSQLERRGLRAMEPETGILAIQHALHADLSQCVVADVHWEKFAPSFEAWGARALLNEVRKAPGASEPSAETPAEPALKQVLAGLPAAERQARLTDWVVAQVARVLSLTDTGNIDLDQPFRNLGMDSLMAVELRKNMAKRLGTQLSADFGLDSALTTTRSLALRLLPLLEDAEPGGAPKPGIEADAVLEADIRPLPQPLPTLEPTSTLLTGATGFLGAFLLSELLQRTSARITCLVRAKSGPEAMERLRKNLQAYGLPTDRLNERVSAVVGDLGLPLLGLGEKEFRRLADEVDSVYNNGAHVSFVAGYGDLKPSHVDATRDILRMASMGRPKAVHHVSSIAAYDSPVYRGKTVSEGDAPVSSLGVQLPYSQCKWVSEALVREAGERGIPVTIHRPGLISGASNGAWNTTDFMCRVLKGGMLDTGMFPGGMEIFLDCSPVDFVAQAIVHLSCQTASRGKTFHVQHPEGILMNGVVEILRSLGYPIEMVPYGTWLAKLAEDESSPIHPLLFFFTHRWAPENLTSLEYSRIGYRAKFASEETTRLLAGADIRCAPLDRALFRRYLERLAASGFVPAPAQ